MSGFFSRGGGGGGPRPGPLPGLGRSPPMFGPRGGGPRSPPFPVYYPPSQPYFRGSGPRPVSTRGGGPGPNRGGMGQHSNGYANGGYNGYNNGYSSGNGFSAGNGYNGFERRPPQPLFSAPPNGGGGGGGGYGANRPQRARGRGGFGPNRTASAGRKRKRGAATVGGAADTAVKIKTEEATSGGDSDNQAKVLKKEKEFFCDTCERGFDTRDKLDEHYGTHYHCDKPGCSFEAHPKIVEMHVQMQHNTGFAEKIMALDSAEQIEKWRDERKKKFPSAVAVAKRQAEQEAKIARGELLTNLAYYTPQSKRGGPPQRGAPTDAARGRGRARGGPWIPRGGRGDGGPQANFRPLMAPYPDSYPPPLMRGRMWFRGGRTSQYVGGGRGAGRGRGGATKAKTATALPKFGGTAQAEADRTVKVKIEPMDTSEQITDSEGETTVPPTPAGVIATKMRNVDVLEDGQPKTAVPKALLGLMSAYQSDTDSDLDNKAEPPLSRPSNVPVETGVKPIDSPTPKEATRRNRKRSKRPVANKFQRQSDDNQQEPRAKDHKSTRKKRATLLEMLLANEIRHERNVILQCVHHVVEQNFFGIGQSKIEKPEPSQPSKILADEDEHKRSVVLQCVQHVVQENFFGVSQPHPVQEAPSPDHLQPVDRLSSLTVQDTEVAPLLDQPVVSVQS